MDNFFLDILSGFWQIIAVIFHALSPLMIGLVLAYLFNPAVEWVRFKIAGSRRRFPREEARPYLSLIPPF